MYCGSTVVGFLVAVVTDPDSLGQSSKISQADQPLGQRSLLCDSVAAVQRHLHVTLCTAGRTEPGKRGRLPEADRGLVRRSTRDRTVIDRNRERSPRCNRHAGNYRLRGSTNRNKLRSILRFVANDCEIVGSLIRWMGPGKRRVNVGYRDFFK